MKASANYIGMLYSPPLAFFEAIGKSTTELAQFQCTFIDCLNTPLNHSKQRNYRCLLTCSELLHVLFQPLCGCFFMLPASNQHWLIGAVCSPPTDITALL